MSNLSQLKVLAENKTVVFYNGEAGTIQRMDHQWEEYAFHYEGGAIPLMEDELVIEGHHIQDVDFQVVESHFQDMCCETCGSHLHLFCRE
jgi:hypothetical protein